MNIKKMRKKHDLSTEDLASRLGVSYATIWRWETKKCVPHRGNRLQLERIIGELEKGA